MKLFSNEGRLAAVKAMASHVEKVSDSRISLRLWDGSIVPLGKRADGKHYFSVNRSDTIGSLLRKPSLDNISKHYVAGNIDFHGTDLMTFLEILRDIPDRKWSKRVNKWFMAKQAIPLVLTLRQRNEITYAYEKEETGRSDETRDNKEYIQFHYDLSNDFYKLFLDPEMVYTCGYFTDWSNSLARAQTDKLDMICRKLRLQPGEKFLDIGCGWGALICHAAKNYGVHAHGVTLSQEQFDYAIAKVKRLGLEDKVTIELKDYMTIEDTFDKISSIGMYEHVGLSNMRAYFKKINSMLRVRGLVLNHGITRRAKPTRKEFMKIAPGRRWILKNIFPGSELDHIGGTLDTMEINDFEIHDVENWREHYARTSRFWHDNLTANKAKAIELVGKEKYRLWIAYLAGVSFSFQRGSLNVYQVVASKKDKGASGLPPTRKDLYVN